MAEKGKKITAFFDENIEWIDGGTIRVGANNPVPVVSLEWLEEYIADSVRETVWLKASDDFSEGEANGRIEAMKILLTAAKKEAGK